MDLSGLQPSETLPAGNAFSQVVKAQHRDFNSNISRFGLLLTLLNTTNLIHLNEIEIVQWHMINIKMLELGLWSKFNFKERSQHNEFSDLLMITALKAKKVSNTKEEFLIYSETVFHNSSLAHLTSCENRTEFMQTLNKKNAKDQQRDRELKT